MTNIHYFRGVKFITAVVVADEEATSVGQVTEYTAKVLMKRVLMKHGSYARRQGLNWTLWYNFSSVKVQL